MADAGEHRSRPAEIADYLLSTGVGDTDAAWRAEVTETIVERWPGVTELELTAAFAIAICQTGADLLDAAGGR